MKCTALQKMEAKFMSTLFEVFGFILMDLSKFFTYFALLIDKLLIITKTMYFI
jgi:hypothetical protein